MAKLQVGQAFLDGLFVRNKDTSFCMFEVFFCLDIELGITDWAIGVT